MKLTNNTCRIAGATSWKSFFETGVENDAPLHFEQLSFDHPMFIMYSSGTTGKPKCMVHSAGGTMIQHAKEHLLHGDMGREDVFIYYTTTGRYSVCNIIRILVVISFFVFNKFLLYLIFITIDILNQYFKSSYRGLFSWLF